MEVILRFIKEQDSFVKQFVTACLLFDGPMFIYKNYTEIFNYRVIYFRRISKRRYEMRFLTTSIWNFVSELCQTWQSLAYRDRAFEKISYCNNNTVKRHYVDKDLPSDRAMFYLLSSGIAFSLSPYCQFLRYTIHLLNVGYFYSCTVTKASRCCIFCALPYLVTQSVVQGMYSFSNIKNVRPKTKRKSTDQKEGKPLNIHKAKPGRMLRFTLKCFFFPFHL